MTNERYNKFRKRIQFVARSLGLSREDIDDCVSDILLQRERGLGRNQNARYAVIDYLRRNGRCTRDGKLPPALRSESIEALEGRGIRWESGVSGGRSGRECLSDAERYLESLSQIERCVMVLRGLWGLDNREIAYCFGVTESRISQIFSRVEKILSRVVAREESGASEGLLQIVSKAAPSGSEGQGKGHGKVAHLLPKEDGSFSRLERYTSWELAKEEPWQVESYHEASFQEWLT